MSEHEHRVAKDKIVEKKATFPEQRFDDYKYFKDSLKTADQNFKPSQKVFLNMQSSRNHNERKQKSLKFNPHHQTRNVPIMGYEQSPVIHSKFPFERKVKDQSTMFKDHKVERKASFSPNLFTQPEFIPFFTNYRRLYYT